MHRDRVLNIGDISVILMSPAFLVTMHFTSLDSFMHQWPAIVICIVIYAESMVPWVHGLSSLCCIVTVDSTV